MPCRAAAAARLCAGILAARMSRAPALGLVGSWGREEAATTAELLSRVEAAERALAAGEGREAGRIYGQLRALQGGGEPEDGPWRITQDHDLTRTTLDIAAQEDRAAQEENRGLRWTLPTGAPYRKESVKALVPTVWDGMEHDKTSRGILRRELAMLSRSQNATLRRIRNGSISKKQVEIVVSHYDEDVAWMEMYEGLATYYCKGDRLPLRYPQRPVKCHSLPNVGREGHTFLTHIITHYDALADWTVFTQAQAPTAGYSGTEGDHANGHMYPGATFHDYVLGGGPFGAEGGDSNGGRFIFNGHWKPPLVGAPGWEKIRMAFAGNYNKDVDRVKERLNTTCLPLKGSEFDLYWGGSEVMLALLAFIDFLGEGRETKLYSQGARFALSRERIRQRPVEFYKTLQSLVNRAVFPISSAFLEFMWYYIPGSPKKGMPCRLEPPVACPEGFEQIGRAHV